MNFKNDDLGLVVIKPEGYTKKDKLRKYLENRKYSIVLYREYSNWDEYIRLFQPQFSNDEYEIYLSQ